MGGLFYWPLGLLSVPVLGYTVLPVLKDALTGIQKREPRIAIIDSIAGFIGIGIGLYALSAFSNTLYYCAMKLLYHTKNKTRKSLSEMFRCYPSKVFLLKDNVEISARLEDVQAHEFIVSHAGEIIPVDGKVISGVAAIDQHK